MRKLLVIILISISGILQAQVPFQSRPTAWTISKHEFEFSLFSPTRFGVGEKTEVFSSVLADWKLPNAGAKHLWWKKPAKDRRGFFRSRDIWFSTVHNLDYPSMFFKSVQDRKPSYISDTCTVPGVITMRNEARVSLYLKKRTSCTPPDFLLTLRAGVKNSFKLNKDYTMPPVDKPLWYRETVVCLDTIVWFAGADLDFHLTGRLNMLVDADFYSVDWNVKDWSGENKLFVYGYFGRNRHVMLQAGAKLVYGPIYGDFKFMAYPMLEFSYFWKLKKKRDQGLWGDTLG